MMTIKDGTILDSYSETGNSDAQRGFGPAGPSTVQCWKSRASEAANLTQSSCQSLPCCLSAPPSPARNIASHDHIRLPTHNTRLGLCRMQCTSA